VVEAERVILQKHVARIAEKHLVPLPPVDDCRAMPQRLTAMDLGS
jgi:hypothetical protein